MYRPYSDLLGSLPAPSLRLRRTLAILALSLACGSGGAQERVSISGLPGGAESPGAPALEAYWFPAPAEATGGRAAPVVIGLHGCSGAFDSRGQLASRWREYARWFNREGYHFLVPESFASRGLKSICETHVSQRTVSESDRRSDVFAALGWLAARPDVDARRLALVGWSHGAQTVMHTVDRSSAFVSAQSHPPRAAVA